MRVRRLDHFGVDVAELERAERFYTGVLGMTVPMRFHAGEPFHAGLGWQMMEVGLKGMSAMLAD